MKALAMSTIHTPAPWSILQEGTEDDCIIRTIIGPGNKPRNLSEVALVTTGSYTDEVEAANARLISAAPELLISLQRIMKYIDDQFLVRNIEKDGEPDFFIRMAPFVMDLKEADAAIKKAVK